MTNLKDMKVGEVSVFKSRLEIVTKENELRKGFIQSLCNMGNPPNGIFKTYVENARECEEKIKRGEL